MHLSSEAFIASSPLKQFLCSLGQGLVTNLRRPERARENFRFGMPICLAMPGFLLRGI